MRPTSRYIPQGATLVDAQGTDTAVYTYEVNRSADGKRVFFSIGYHGKANKPDFHYSHRSAEARAQHIAEYLNGRQARAAMMSERRQKQHEPHTLQVGDILKASWGYDQTNIDYYEVTRVVSAHTVEIREIGQAREETGWLQGKCAPQSGSYTSEPSIHRADKGNSVKVRDWGVWASKVDMLDVSRWSAYA